ncbi:MAG: hypothetical protein E6K76_05220, partial [Candidatus Eisenbacteria bacterium]
MVRSKVWLWVCFTLGVAVATAAFADQDARERAQDRAQIRTDRVEVSRDVAEVRRLERLLAHLDSA